MLQYAVKVQTSLAPLSWCGPLRLVHANLLRTCTNVSRFQSYANSHAIPYEIYKRNLQKREPHSWDPRQRPPTDHVVTFDFNNVLRHYANYILKNALYSSTIHIFNSLLAKFDFWHTVAMHTEFNPIALHLWTQWHCLELIVIHRLPLVIYTPATLIRNQQESSRTSRNENSRHIREGISNPSHTRGGMSRNDVGMEILYILLDMQFGGVLNYVQTHSRANRDVPTAFEPHSSGNRKIPTTFELHSS